MRHAPLPIAMLGAAVLAALLPLPAFAQEKEEVIQKRLAERLPVINDLKNKEKVGEAATGYLEAVKPAYLDEEIEYQKKKVSVRDFLAAENADRKAVYALIAERKSTPQEKVTVEQVAERSAKDLFARASPGHWLLNEKGKWIQKPRR